jgi:hypothetical protein
MSTEADIVERLERFARVGAGVAVLIDAAEEIKQLRAEVEKLRAFCRTHICDGCIVVGLQEAKRFVDASLAALGAPAILPQDGQT